MCGAPFHPVRARARAVVSFVGEMTLNTYLHKPAGSVLRRINFTMLRLSPILAEVRPAAGGAERRGWLEQPHPTVSENDMIDARRRGRGSTNVVYIRNGF